MRCLKCTNFAESNDKKTPEVFKSVILQNIFSIRCSLLQKHIRGALQNGEEIFEGSLKDPETSPPFLGFLPSVGGKFVSLCKKLNAFLKFKSSFIYM